MIIKKMEVNQRPRERLITCGVEALSDYELLAIMIGSGTKEMSALELASYLIKEYGLDRLLNMKYEELKQIKGIKEAKATKLMSCFELARRSLQTSQKEIYLRKAEDIYKYSISDFLFLKTEKLMVIYVDAKCKVLSKLLLSNDEVGRVSFPLKKILQNAFSFNAYGIFLVHNHPSGDVEPSVSDITSTKKIYHILQPVNVVVLDHLIVSKKGFYSFEEHHLLN